MKKLLSIILTVVMLSTMMSFFTVFTSADDTVKTGPSLESQYYRNDMADVYYIYTPEDFVFFFNNRGEFAMTEIRLENDIDLNPGWIPERVAVPAVDPGEDGILGTADDVNYDTYIIDKTGLTTTLTISSQVWFKGESNYPAIFNGQGHSICGAYVEGVGGNEGAAILGRVQNAIIKDVAFENSATISLKEDGTLGSRVGGIVTIAKDDVVFENVYSDVLVTGASQVGGFVALNMNSDTTSVTYNDCISICDIVARGSAVGGFVGDSWDRSATTLNNCGFYGAIEVIESTSGSDPRACGMLVGKTSAGTSKPAAQAMLNSSVTLNNCIGAGYTNANRDWNGALIGYTFFGSHINSTNSSYGMQYISVSINNCVYLGNFSGAIGSNRDPEDVLNNNFNCDVRYRLSQTSVAWVEDEVLLGYDAVLKIDGVFDLTEDWVMLADFLPMPYGFAEVFFSDYLDDGQYPGGGIDYIIPQLRINSLTNEWEVSYDNGYTWESLGVKATGDQGAQGATGNKGDKGDKGDKGEQGASGITPKMRINADTNEWEVSYDDGQNWESLGIKATGEKGEKGDRGDQGEKGENVTVEARGCAGSIGLAGVALVAVVATVGVVCKRKED